MLVKTLKTVFFTFFTVTFLWTIYVALQVIFNPAQVGEFVHPDMGLTIEQLVEKHGYPFEKHTTTTYDGYILELHRIPYKTQLQTTKQPRPVILLMHGLSANSFCWVMQGPGKSVAYIFADHGYDVWMGNARGNSYSRKHVSLDPDEDKKDFWNFSWNEIGSLDLPASIDYIQNVTGQEKIFYAGHSQGTVSFMVMLSERPEYNEKIRLMIALAPVIYLHDIRSIAFRLPAFIQGILEACSDCFNIREIFKATEIKTQIVNMLCHENSWVQFLCIIPFAGTCGYNEKQLNKTNFPLITSHLPDGAALRQLLHYTQVLNTDEFKKYDHGRTKNLKVYGQPTPPFYNFANIKANISLYFGENDYVTSRKDHEHLRRNLPNVVRNYVVPDKDFGHFDFITAIDMYDLLYKDILTLMRKY